MTTSSSILFGDAASCRCVVDGVGGVSRLSFLLLLQGPPEEQKLLETSLPHKLHVTVTVWKGFADDWNDIHGCKPFLAIRTCIKHNSFGSHHAHFETTAVALVCISHLPYVSDVWHSSNTHHPQMLWIMYTIIQKGYLHVAVVAIEKEEWSVGTTFSSFPNLDCIHVPKHVSKKL
jgi:hypothetical protein